MADLSRRAFFGLAAAAPFGAAAAAKAAVLPPSDLSARLAELEARAAAYEAVLAKARAQTFAALRLGWLTVSEIRAREDAPRPPSEDATP